MTYSPEEPRPRKAIEGARKGKAQKSHDHCHAQFHRGTGAFAGKTPEERDAWEQDCVAKSRQRYAMQAPARIEPISPTSRLKRAPRLGAGWTVATIHEWCRKEAAIRPAQAADALTELANLIEEDVRG